MPLALFLIPYGLFLLVYGVFSLFALMHLFIFGEKNMTTFLATFLYIAGSVLLLFASWTYLAALDWKAPIAVMTSFL